MTNIFGQSSTVDIFYGNQFFTNNFYNQLNSLSAVDLNKPTKVFSIGVMEHLSTKSKNKDRLYSKLRFSAIQTNRVSINDTLNFDLNSYGFTYGFAYDIIGKRSDKTKKKLFYCLVDIGFGTGLTVLGNNNKYNQRNPYFSPKIGIQPSVRIKKIMISLVFEYMYDVSNGKWKKMRWGNKDIAPIDNFKQTNLLGQFCLSYCLN